MAIDIVAGTTAESGIPHFNLAGTSITKEEEVDVDVYKGPKAELIAVGIVTEEMWPKGEKRYISWSQGKQVIRNCKKDQTYRNINAHWDMPRVSVGLPAEVRKARKLTWKSPYQRELEAKEAALARQQLANLPKSGEEFKRKKAIAVREVIRAMLEPLGQSPHGFRLAEDACSDIELAIDGVMDAIMAAEVVCDAAVRSATILKCQSKIRAADPAFYAQLDKLTAFNPSLLEGESK